MLPIDTLFFFENYSSNKANKIISDLFPSLTQTPQLQPQSTNFRVAFRQSCQICFVIKRESNYKIRGLARLLEKGITWECYEQRTSV